jgi:hypothetical protein
MGEVRVMVDEPTSQGKRLEDPLDGELADCSSEELREFIEADSLEPLADAGFKHRLRRLLWDILRKQIRD